MSHRPEPWRTDQACGFHEDIHGADGPMLAHCFGQDGYLNARRIVACINACSGMSQQYLEELNGKTLIIKQRTLIEQRDTLCVALERLTDVFATIGITSGIYDDEQDALKFALDVLCSVKESK